MKMLRVFLRMPQKGHNSTMNDDAVGATGDFDGS